MMRLENHWHVSWFYEFLTFVPVRQSKASRDHDEHDSKKTWKAAVDKMRTSKDVLVIYLFSYLIYTSPQQKLHRDSSWFVAQ